MKKTVAFCTLGCKVNQYETDAMRGSFEAEGYEVKEFSQEASVYVINTCTVTNMADRKSRQMMHRAKKKNPDGIIVAVGCYVQAAKEQLEEDTLIDLVIGNNMKSQVVQIVEQYIQDNRHTEDRDAYVADIAHSHEYETMHIETVSEHTRAYIKIQDGCNQFCSYCIIPFARGRVRSRRPEDVLREVRRLAAGGCREVVLTGIHISSYGMDFIEKTDGDYLESGSDLRQTAQKRQYLLNLVREIAGTEGIERVRLGSLEPRIITREFAEGLAALPQVCPHFHLSLQSGCDATLKRMNRHYTAEEYYEKVRLLREVFDNPAITTDVIVGFPGETEEEFETTAAFLEKVHFFEMHVFKYSVRKGTVAASMKDQVPEQVKNERSARLIEMEKRLSGEYRAQYIGKEITVLTEDCAQLSGKSWRLGHTQTYVKAAVPVSHAGRNELITGRVTGFLTDEVLRLEPVR